MGRNGSYEGLSELLPDRHSDSSLMGSFKVGHIKLVCTNLWTGTFVDACRLRAEKPPADQDRVNQTSMPCALSLASVANH